jgi:hypothetical protein
MMFGVWGLYPLSPFLLRFLKFFVGQRRKRSEYDAVESIYAKLLGLDNCVDTIMDKVVRPSI